MIRTLPSFQPIPHHPFSLMARTACPAHLRLETVSLRLDTVLSPLASPTIHSTSVDPNPTLAGFNYDTTCSRKLPGSTPNTGEERPLLYSYPPSKAGQLTLQCLLASPSLLAH